MTDFAAADEPYCDGDEDCEDDEEDVVVFKETGVLAFSWAEFGVVVVAAAKHAWFSR